MKKILKICFLCIITLSVYFIYQKTQNATYTVMSIGDKVSLGINSFGARDYSYIDYLKEEFEKEKGKVEIIKKYSSKEQSIRETLHLIQNTPYIKRDLSDADILIITLGYNDLMYSLSIEEDLSPMKLNKITKEIEKDYQELIQEIKKYYHKKIIIVGYFPSNTKDYYKNKGMEELNRILKEKEVFIDTYHLLEPREKYFENPKSYYPNTMAYERIACKIMQKILENNKNI